MNKTNEYHHMPQLVGIVILAFLYILTGKLGLLLAVPPGYATIIWPPSGIAIGSLIIHRARLWPGVLIGSWLLNTYISHGFDAQHGLIGVKVLIAFLIACGSTLQALVAYSLVRRYVGLPLQLHRFTDVVKLILLAGPVSCLVAATVGVGALVLAGDMPLSNVLGNWLTWWAGDLFGVLIFLPLVIIAPGNPKPMIWRNNRIGTLPVLALLTTFVPLGLTFYAWKTITENTYQSQQATFNALVAESEKALLHRLDSYNYALLSGKAFVQNRPKLTEQDWQSYAQVLDAKNNFPGILGVGWITAVSPEQLQAFLHQHHTRDGVPLQIHPSTHVPPYDIVTYIEPWSANHAAYGLNIAFEKSRRDSAELARDSGRPTITGPIMLVQDLEHSPGFLMLYPVYQDGTSLNTVSDRRSALRGWVYAPFKADTLLEGLTQSQGELIDIDIHDANSPPGETLIYSSSKEIGGNRPTFSTTRTIQVFQRQWQVTWTTLPAFDSQTRSGTGLFVLLGGLLFTALFVLFLMTLMLRDQTVEQWLVHERRMVIPTIIFITITAFMFGLYSLLKQRELSNIQNIVYEKSNKINKLIFHEVKDRLLSIDRMASRWVVADGTSYPQWRNDAANHLRDQMGLTSLEVLNSQLVTQWIEPTDVNGSEIGTALAVNPRQIQLLTDAKEAHHLALLIEPTKDNQQAIMQEFVPLYAKNVFDGFMVGEFDLHALFGNILDPELADDFSVTILSKGQILFKQTPEKTTLVEALTTYSTMRLYDQTWQIRLTPTEHWVNNQLSNLPNVILMSGLLISVLLALTVRAVLLARLKSRDLLTSEEKLRLSNIKLQQSVEQLASSNLELERFAHVASHDMQEPLRMISGFSDLVLKDYADKLDGEGKTYLTMIYDGSERMRVMIRDLLDYSRINREKVEKVCVCGETALKLALDNLNQLISETNAQISHDPIPDFSGNPIQIMRLLQNLIANAIKYQQIGQTPHVHVSVQQKADELLFSVQDNGIGVEPSFIETVFEPFRRLHHWDRIKGSGMGLAVCRKIVENHGGKIWMTSTPGEGTQVWFSISLVEGAK